MRRFERRNFILIVLDGSLFAFAISFLSEATIVPAFVQTLTGSAALVGLVGATYAVGRYLPQLVGAHLTLGRPRRKAVLFWIVVAERIGILAVALTAQTIGMWDSTIVIVLFFLSFGAYAVTTGLIGPVYGDFLAKALPRSRGWFYGISQLLGGVLGFSAALFAERVLSEWAFPTGNQITFWLCFGLSFLSIPLVASLRDDAYPDIEPRQPFRTTLRSIPHILTADAPFRQFLSTRAILATATAGMGLVVVHGLTQGYITAADAAITAAAFILSQATGGFLLSILGHYRGWKTVVVTGGLLLTLSMTGALIAQDLTGIVLVYAALGAANATTIIGDPNFSIELAPPSRTSIYLGTTSTLLAPFFIVGALLGGITAATIGYPTVFVTAGILAAIGTVRALFLPEPRTVRARTTPCHAEVATEPNRLQPSPPAPAESI